MSIVFCNQKTGYEVRISDWSSDVGSSDKIVARRTADKLGLPLVPGSDGAVLDVEEAASIAREIGYPIRVKAAAGGGGRGMKVARDQAGLREAIGLARAEAQAIFGATAIYIEKFIVRPRQLALQI